MTSNPRYPIDLNNHSVTSREAILTQIVTASSPMVELKESVSKLGWDSDKPIVILEAKHCKQVLQRYIDGSLTGKELETWGNLIESREDIKEEEAFENEIKDFVFDISNPILAKKVLTPRVAKEWVKRLSSDV